MKKKTIKLVVFLAVALAVFFGLSEAVKDVSRTCITTVKGLYTEPEDSLDVVLIGASEVYSGFCPTQAWQEQGFTSFDYGSVSAPGNLYKYMLKEALRTQNPKVVVFELNGFLYNDDYYTDVGHLHKYIDNMKISKNWVDAIKNCVPEEEQMDYLFPISTYHDSWKHPAGSVKTIMTKALIQLSNRCHLKGMSTFSLFRNPEEPVTDDEGLMLTELGKQYLEDLCETCREEGIEHVLFVRFPHLRKTADEQLYPRIEEIVTSYGFDFLNVNDYTQFGLDDIHDFYNTDHMNFYGMKVFTSYFGQYLAEHYDLPSSHEEEIEERWQISAEKTDEILRQCEVDVQRGEIRHYTETACYFTPRLRDGE